MFSLPTNCKCSQMHHRGFPPTSDIFRATLQPPGLPLCASLVPHPYRGQTPFPMRDRLPTPAPVGSGQPVLPPGPVSFSKGGAEIWVQI